MSLPLASLTCASAAFALGLVWFGWFLSPSWSSRAPGRRWSVVLLQAYLLLFAAAYVVGSVVRWTFASDPIDGAFIGLLLWTLALAVDAAGSLLADPPAPIRRGAAVYWLVALSLTGTLMALLQRPPGLIEVFRGP